MKNKTKTYLLMVLVITIWGVVGYKIYTTLNPSLPELELSTIPSNVIPNKIIVNDTFSLKPIKRDPFLGSLKQKPMPIKKTKSIKETTIDIPIQFLGTISKKKSARLYIISINNVQYFLKKGEEIQGVKLVRGNDSQITVSYQGVVKSFKRS